MTRTADAAIVVDALHDVSLPHFDPDRVERLRAFGNSVASVFPRSDQVQRLQAYLRGLLEPGGRKNVGTIAASAGDMHPGEIQLAQSLQHFITHSQWDANRLFAEYRGLIRDSLADASAVWVVHDGIIAKKGRHSVGTQRQFARSVGRKINCQIAVVVSQVGRTGYFPLASRLYLPGNWLKLHAERAERTVPENYRNPSSKAAIALDLIDELRRGGISPACVCAEEGYASIHEFADGLAARRLAFPDTPALGDQALAETQLRFEWLKTSLGLDHYEGRTWTGWHHHVSLVFLAYAFLARERISPRLPPFVEAGHSTISS